MMMVSLVRDNLDEPAVRRGNVWFYLKNRLNGSVGKGRRANLNSLAAQFGDI